MSVSVLMPVYNTRRAELQVAIESILDQTYKDFEFIIINDGSTNDAEEVILDYKDDRIKYYKNETNLKLISTLNRGIDLCSGKYIARLDSDDYSEPDRLEKQVKVMEELPNVGLTGSFFKRVPENITITTPVRPDIIKLCQRYVNNCVAHSSAMIRKSVLTENNLRYNSYCVHAEDYKLWCDMSYVCDIVVIPETLITVKTNADGVSQSNLAWQRKMVTVIMMENMIRDFPCDKKYLYSVLFKYIEGTVVSDNEFEDMKDFLSKVTQYLQKVMGQYYSSDLIFRSIMSIPLYFVREK